jgi:hypothetical protein
VNWQSSIRGIAAEFSQIWLKVREESRFLFGDPKPPLSLSIYTHWQQARTYDLNMAISTLFFPQNMAKIHSAPLLFFLFFFLCSQVENFCHKKIPWEEAFIQPNKFG